MNDELDILKIVAENPDISQRKIAEQTGISLGQVNFLIKKCVRKGLIKIEGQTAKSIKYNLTPKGIAEKAALTLEYIKISYGAVIAITSKVRQIVIEQKSKKAKVYLFGNYDEMMELTRTVLHEEQVDFSVIPFAELDDKIILELNLNTAKGAPYNILCWDKEADEILIDYNHLNILTS